jgi:hypothetical protein
MDDYLDGYLDEADKLVLEDHLEECATCSASLQELESLLRQSRQRSTALSPERDLWPGILERIDHHGSGRRATAYRHWLPLAAVLALAVLLLPLLLRQDAPESVQQVERTATESIKLAAATQTLAELARSEDRVLLTRRDLIEAIEMRRDLLGPEAYQSVEESLQVLDQAVAEIRLALNENPDDRRLRLALAAKYQQEVRLLQRVSRI